MVKDQFFFYSKASNSVEFGLQLVSKVKLLRNYKFHHLIIILTLLLMVDSRLLNMLGSTLGIFNIEILHLKLLETCELII